MPCGVCLKRDFDGSVVSELPGVLTVAENVDLDARVCDDKVRARRASKKRCAKVLHRA